MLATAYAISHPPAADLAAQTARAELVERAGNVVWWTRWYAGIETPGYGVVPPPLMALIGVTATGVLALLLTGAVAPALVREARRPGLAAVLLVAMQAANLYAGRTTFALGSAVALGAVVLVLRERALPGALAAALAALTSPVAGLFLGVALGAVVLGDRQGRRVAALAAGVGAGAVLAGYVVLFPAGGAGEQPFAGWLLRDCLLVTAAVALLPVSRRVRLGALLTAALLVGAYVVPSAVGSNASRLPLLLAVPAVAASARLRGPLLAVALVVLTAFPANELRKDLRDLDPARTTDAYYAPLLAALDREPAMRAGARVEVVEPRDHWHAARVAARYPLARGWQRQADVERTAALYRPEPLAPAPLTPAAYRQFLDENAVAVVAVAPDAPVDFASAQERDVVLRGLPYLSDAGRHGAWQLFRVRDPVPIVRSGAAVVVGADDSGVTIRADRADEVRLRVRWTPYAVVTPGGCARDDAGWTAVRVPGPGTYRLSARFRPTAALTQRHGSCGPG